MELSGRAGLADLGQFSPDSLENGAPGSRAEPGPLQRVLGCRIELRKTAIESLQKQTLKTLLVGAQRDLHESATLIVLSPTTLRPLCFNDDDGQFLQCDQVFIRYNGGGQGIPEEIPPGTDILFLGGQDAEHKFGYRSKIDRFPAADKSPA